MIGWKMSVLGLWLVSDALGPCSERTEAAAPTPGDSKPAPPTVEQAEHRPNPPVATSQGKQQTATTKTYMKEHFAEADAMRRAAIGGRLTELKGAATGLSGDDWSPRLRPTWQAHVTDVRAAARAVNTATTLDQGAAALASLGSACASCHRTVGGPAPVSAITVPAKSDERPMLEHVGAEDLLWRGLTFPSDSSWIAGARALRNAPALGSDVAQVAAVARRLQSLAQRAEFATETREQLYGEILRTCANCHEKAGVKTAVTF